MKDYLNEFPEALYEELEKRFGLQIANEVMKAVRLNVGKRMAELPEKKLIPVEPSDPPGSVFKGGKDLKDKERIF